MKPSQGCYIGNLGLVLQKIEKPLTLTRVVGSYFHQGDTLKTTMNRLADLDLNLFNMDRKGSTP